MNLLETGLSFIEGLALIASPCILPVLPLILAGSVDGGKKRPFGIIVGFVFSFTLFAMLSRKLVMAFDIDLDYIKYGSLVLLTLFAFILLSSKLSELFSSLTNRFANAGNGITANAKDGFLSGIIIGFLIGLVWTPCAGPILAAVLVQVIRQQNDLSAISIIAAFAIGAAVPMLIIALTGRSIINKLGFFTKHAQTVRKSFGVIILLAVVFIASGTDVNALFGKNQAYATAITTSTLSDALPEPYPAPEFSGISAWLNSTPLTMGSLKGKVVLVDFWTYSCVNCVRTLPYLARWDKKYRNNGLVIIGVHSPEFEFEKNKANVMAALSQYDINYPVALDNQLDTWTAFNNRYWPAHYLIDRDGKVVYTHFGEGNYAETENNIRILLGIDKIAADHDDDKYKTAIAHITPETYLGYERADNFGGNETINPDSITEFHFPESLAPDNWALSGTWKVEAQHITSDSKTASIKINFTAKKLFLVLGSASGKHLSVKLLLNGEPVAKNAGKDVKNGILTVKNHTLYELINQQSVQNSTLEVTSGPGLEAYAFTFGK